MEGVIIILIVGIGLFSYQGFRDQSFFERFKFRVADIQQGKEYIRLLTAGLLHVDWMHFGINMFVLYMFGPPVMYGLGMFPFLGMLLVSMIAGNFFALFVQRSNPMYSAVGFSGATSGLVFAYVAFYPTKDLYFIFFPFIGIPAWIMGIGFLLISYIGMRRRSDNIGHEAHIGGAVAGLLMVILIQPVVVISHWQYLIALTLPILWMVYDIFIRKSTNGISGQSQPWKLYEPDKSKSEFVSEEEMDRILDKVQQYGHDSLTDREKQALKQHFK